MSIRTLLFGSFVIFVAVLFNRDRARHSVTVHTPAQPVSFTPNASARPYFTHGPISQISLPTVSLFDRFGRKKIDNFIFNHYNQVKFEFTFVDLGYTSNFMFSFFAEEGPALRLTQRLGFDLDEDMLAGTLNLDITKRNLRLSVRQTVFENQITTTFNLTLSRINETVSANLTHILKNEHCFTAIRSEVVSHKCYGGLGSGKIRIDRILPSDLAVTEPGQQNIFEGTQRVKKTNVFNPTYNLTRVSYDGLRGSGMHWNWVWATMSGFSKIEYYSLNHTIPTEHHLGLNFGHLFGQGQDFFFIDGQVIPIQGLQYTYNQNAKLKSNMTVTATHPRMQVNFTVLEKEHKTEDLGVIKLDLVKLEGMWSGWVERPHDGKKYEFYLMAGFIQSSDSLF